MLEDVNIEQMLDAFTAVNTNSGDVWGARTDFMSHSHWDKLRLAVLGPGIKGLPVDHPPSHYACSGSHGCLTQLKISWSENDPLLMP